MVALKITNKNLLIYLFAILMGYLISCNSDPFPHIILPVHPDAISVTRMSNSPVKGAKSVVYNFSIEFPATEIISFYNRELASNGYKPFDAEIESRPLQKWSRFNTKTGKFEEITEPPGRYVAHWVNDSQKTWIWLVISLEGNALDKSGRILAEVSCNIAKFSAYEESLRLIKKMK